ncbi:hypothetical protein B0T26DRAFT_734616 [Lasiosphaeria miniovina]|uniref:Uncharacterized protein n=1 Tax=Lasiosphaeria miniovina TaxID=1954250 RepID=A0AA39ZQF0_9PEZI|nr:uncharacterized protein B0T26DRAFT_734616 [Lasiosphaeria miniovina]KAK0701785.1 hypothetical protein B0T26DRAFT_734616 [Lasiosphaeria miniovina]
MAWPMGALSLPRALSTSTLHCHLHTKSRRSLLHRTPVSEDTQSPDLSFGDQCITCLKNKGAVLLVTFARRKTQRLLHWSRANKTNNSPPHICMYRAKNRDSILIVDFDQKEDSLWSVQIPGFLWCPGTRRSE